MKKIILRIWKDHRCLLVILVLALLVRLLYLFLLHPPLIWADSSAYNQLALNLISNQGYVLTPGQPYVGLEPGYALFFLAPLYWLWGGANILLVQVFQIFLSLGIIAGVYYLARRYFSQNVALWAIALFAFYPPLVAYSTEILTETAFTFLLFAGVLVFDALLYKPSWQAAACGGLLFGVATLTRFISFFLPFFLSVIFFFHKSHRVIFKKALVMLALFLLVIFPWFLRNYLVFDKFIFGRAYGGAIFWSGSYLPWDGEWKGHVAPLNQLVDDSSTPEANEKLMKLAWQNIKDNPTGVFLMWLKKPAKVFLKSEFNSVLERDNSFSRILKGISPYAPGLLKGILFSINLVLVILVGLGLFLAFRQNPTATILLGGVIFYFILFYLPLNSDSRYKLPLMPYMFILAGVSLSFFWHKLKAKPRQA